MGPCFDLQAAIFFKILYIIVFVLQSNVSSWTTLYYRQFVSSQKCPKSYFPYLYNTDTSVKRTLGSVPLLSVLKRLDCSHKITKLRAECLLPSVVKNLFGGLIIYEKGNNCRKRHTINFKSVFNVYKNIYCRIGFNLSPPLGQFIGV